MKKFRASLLDTSLSSSKEIGTDDYNRGAHLLKMLTTFEERKRDLEEQEGILSSEVERIKKLMSTSVEMANKFRLALRVMGADMEELETGSGTDVQSLMHAYRIAERESMSLARDLHDGPAQKLASAVLLVELVERMIKSGDIEKALDELHQITDQVREALWDTRSFLLRLNPKGLEYGLDLALKRFIDQIRIISDTEVVLSSKGDFSVLSLPQRSNIFKIIHQAVMNAVQKGKARKVQIFLNGGRKTLHARIIDDGAGFEVEEAIKQAKERGVLRTYEHGGTDPYRWRVHQDRKFPWQGYPYITRDTSIGGGFVLSVYRIVLADDHKLFRDGLERLLNLEPDVEVVGRADNGEEALGVVEERKNRIFSFWMFICQLWVVQNC